MVGVSCRFGRFTQTRYHAVPRLHDQFFSKLRQVVLLLVSASIAVVSGCASLAGPEYVSPNPPLKQGWSLNAADPASAATDIPVDWWTGFGDLYLNDLIKRALLDSQDIKILAARLEAADIGIDQERSNNIPKINLNIETDTLPDNGGIISLPEIEEF